MPVLAAIAVLALAALYFYLRSAPDHTGAEQSFRNPLDLKFVLSLGALIAVIAVAAKVASETFGQAGLLAVAGLSGFADVDPVTVSSARLAGYVDHAGSSRAGDSACSGREFGDQDERDSGSAAGGSPLP